MEDKKAKAKAPEKAKASEKAKAPEKAKTYKMKPLKDCAEVTILKNFGQFKKGQKRRMHDSMVDLLKSKGVI